MDLIEPTFSEMVDRVEKAAEAQEARVEALLAIEDPSTLEVAELSEAQEARTAAEDIEMAIEISDLPHPDREGTVSGPKQEKSNSNDKASGADGWPEEDKEATPRRLPAAKREQVPEIPLRQPVIPRKNVIPSRRTSPGVNGVPATMNKDSLLTGNRQTKQLDQSPAVPAPPVKPSELEVSPSQKRDEIQPDIAEQPTGSDMSQADVLASLRFAASPSSTNTSVDADQPSGPSASGPGAPVTAISASQHSKVHIDTDRSGVEVPGTPASYWPDLPTYAGLSAIYHNTLAAEEAWREADLEDEVARQDTHILTILRQDDAMVKPGEQKANVQAAQRSAAPIETRKIATLVTPTPPVPPAPVRATFIDAPTTPLPILVVARPSELQRKPLTRQKALLMVALLAIVLINAISASFNQSFGAQGWANAWDSQRNTNPNLLTQIAQQFLHSSPTPSNSNGTAIPAKTPAQIVDLLLSNMTLDEKLGQMMMVQFTGPDYSPQLDAMITQYKIGSVLVFAANGNIISKSQLKNLTAQMQKNAFLPLSLAIDQEGGTVDRLATLDGPQPSAATIGASGDARNAYNQGIKDAQNLASYGLNLNLAPVVDVTNVYNSQLYGRTYGTNPAIVTSMSGAYLQGLQKSGKVLGTLKHFPGLGDVSVDPHYRPPDLQRSLNSLNSIDWAPYSSLIKQGNVHAIMVTHEYVKALDTTEPSSLSPKVIGILRNQMHFQGVIMTDSLTMDSISNYYGPDQAAAMAVEAGDDLLMGAASPNDLAAMLKGIKQAISSGAISQQQINDAVRRILLLKYQMGLIHV
ncbi:MAG TPA: glycoside hydrolase family 3 N-terminal domain-containing protein [Ktedonobacteraceae bacterium]